MAVSECTYSIWKDAVAEDIAAAANRLPVPQSLRGDR